MLYEYEINGVIFYLYNKILQPQNVKELNVRCNELRPFIKMSGALMARWIDKFVHSPTNLWYMVLDKFYTLDKYSKDVRYYIRLGQRNFDLIREKTKEKIVSAIISVDSKVNYSKKNIDKNFINSHVESLSDSYQFWLVKDKSGEIVGYVLIYVEQDQIQIRTFHLLEWAKKKGGSYFVNYKLSEIFLLNKGMKKIFYGMRNLVHQTTVQSWLEKKFFYRKQYVKMKVCLMWKAKLLYYIFLPFKPLLKVLPFAKTKMLLGFVEYIYLVNKDKKE